MVAEIDDLVRALRRAAGSEDEPGAWEKAEAIARIGGEAAVRALVSVLETMAAIDLSEDTGDGADECWRASTAAAHGLGRLGAVAVPALLALVSGPPTRARRYAARALGTTRAAQALPVLLALAHDPEDRGAALDALGRLGNPAALPVLRAAASAPDDQERALAAAAIGELRHPQSVELLRALLADPSWYVRYRACEALAQSEADDARSAIRIALDDADPRVAGIARAALG